MNLPLKRCLTSFTMVMFAGCMHFESPADNEAQLRSPVARNLVEKIELPISSNKWELTKEHKTELARFVKILRSRTKMRDEVKFSAVMVTGHTDSIGPIGQNVAISERVADATRDFLVYSEHVEPGLVVVAGKGPTEPVPVTEFCDRGKMSAKQLRDCLAPNRRITVEVIGTTVVKSPVTEHAGKGYSGDGNQTRQLAQF